MGGGGGGGWTHSGPATGLSDTFIDPYINFVLSWIGFVQLPASEVIIVQPFVIAEDMLSNEKLNSWI